MSGTATVHVRDQIAFKGAGEIYIMNADGSAQTQLTDNMVHDTNPAWRPRP